MNHKKRLIKDKIYQALISMISLIGLVVLIAVFVYIFRTGSQLLSWKLLTGDYYSTVYDGYYTGDPISGDNFTAPSNLSEDEYFSSRWGIALKDSKDTEGKSYILVVYVDKDSPLANLDDKNSEGDIVNISSGQSLDKVIFSDNSIIMSSQGAKIAAETFDAGSGIKDIMTSTTGGGIRGSLITTFCLIVLTLIVALPLGISVAIYLNEYASKNNRIIEYLRRLIEMLNGVPSIIFGLMGAAVFIPIVSSVTKAEGGNLITGALTLAVIVLPLIITSTEEALKVIPNEYREASLALGANKTQTTFKVILRSAIPGILSATLLSIGRIIGESAALIYAIGTAIKDKIIITEKSTSLAVHIWSIMSGESPNFALASAISIIILIFVLMMNFTVKIIARRFER